MKNLWTMLKDLKEDCEFVELSHPVAPESPLWAGFEPIREKTVYSFEEDNFIAKEYTLVSQNSTHIDAPIHFYREGKSLDELDTEDFLLPLVVIDKSEVAKENPDYAISKADIQVFEADYGSIPEGAFVALRTDWSKRKENFDNLDEDGVAHFPGWSIEATKYLIEECKVKGIGHEVSDTDASHLSVASGSLDVETYVLEQNVFQIELMRNLDKMPPTGSLIFIGYPKVIDAPGFTARCIGVHLKD